MVGMHSLIWRFLGNHVAKTGLNSVHLYKMSAGVCVKRLLLLQPRNDADAMADHEMHCIQRRFGDAGVAVTAYQVVDSPADVRWLDGMDGLIIGGSGDYSVHDPRSQKWVNPMRVVLDAALKRGVPGFGLCFGHQLLGLHLGSSVVTDPECEEVGTVTLPLTDTGRKDLLFQDFDDQLTCHTGHSDCVVDVPVGVDLLVTGNRTRCQAFRVRGTRFYSTQFHPDLSGAEARERYASNKRDIHGLVSPAVQQRLEMYRKGQDESNVLLHKFIDTLVD